MLRHRTNTHAVPDAALAQIRSQDLGQKFSKKLRKTPLQIIISLERFIVALPGCNLNQITSLARAGGRPW